MALLRNSTRVLASYLRFYSTETASSEIIRVTRTAGRAIPGVLLQESDFSINKYMQEDKIINSKDWTICREEFMASKKFKITESTVDMIIVNLCLTQKKLEMAMRYLEYLLDSKGEINLSAMSSYLKMCHLRDGIEPNDQEKKYLLSMYDTIRKKYTVLDSSTAESCILGITKTSRWRESLELFEMIKISSNPRSIASSALISAAFNYDEPDIGWKYLGELLGRLNADHSVYKTYLRYCERNFKGDRLVDEITKMFKFWGDHDIRVHVDVIEAFEKTFAGLGWTSERTSIRDAGMCRTCDVRLDNLKLTEEEFEKLARTVRERVIVGSDVYRRTTPKEYREFMKFVQESKPWDIVVDGLNVSYMTKVGMKPDGALLRNCVQKCVGMKKKVLIMGRKHMIRWPKLDLQYIRKNAQIFFAEDGSADDPYMLYATLCSGPKTMFVSRDLMRQHNFLLEDLELRRIFKYWQMTNQMSPCSVNAKSGHSEIQLILPPKYLPVVQEHENGWHVPFTFDPSLQPPAIYVPPRSWVCFKKNGTKVA